MLYLNFNSYINYKFKVIMYFHIYNMFKKFYYYYLLKKKKRFVSAWCWCRKPYFATRVVSRKKCRSRASLL